MVGAACLYVEALSEHNLCCNGDWELDWDWNWDNDDRLVSVVRSASLQALSTMSKDFQWLYNKYGLKDKEDKIEKEKKGEGGGSIIIHRQGVTYVKQGESAQTNIQ